MAKEGETVGGKLTTADGSYALSVTLRVVRAQPLPTEGCFVGGRFDRSLGDGELSPFLRPSPAGA
jgi:hypothetical protein